MLYEACMKYAFLIKEKKLSVGIQCVSTICMIYDLVCCPSDSVHRLRFIALVSIRHFFKVKNQKISSRAF